MSAGPESLRIAVVGAGAMGGYFAGRIAESGIGVVLVDVDEQRLAAMRRDGLRVEDRDGDRRVFLPACRAAELTSPCDLVIVFTKGMHTAAAARSVGHVVTPETTFLTLQNGLGNPEQIRSIYPEHAIAFGTTDIPVDLVGPAHVASHGTGTVRFWSMDGQPSQRLDRIRDTLVGAGIAATLDAEVSVAVWEKAAFNAALNALTALARVPVGGLDTADGRHLIGLIISEAVAAAAAVGIAADESRIWGKIDFALSQHRSHQPSMLQDLQAGRMTEVDTINGAITRASRSNGIAAPVNDFVVKLVGIAQGGRPTG